LIEICPNLFVGSQDDEARIRGQLGWFVIHACKEPYHREALGYTGRGAPKEHPEYLMATRNGRLILNLVDVDNVAFIAPDIIDAALAAIGQNITSLKILVHCNQGMSRSPTIALLYLAQTSDAFRGQSSDEGMRIFRGLYPGFSPAKGMADFVRLHWQRYTTGNTLSSL
jgi:hypothetical protein